MNVELIPPKTKKDYVSSSSLLLIAFATVFFPRILQTFGAPPAINFLHFLAVPLACGIAIFNTRTKNRRQINTSKKILFALVLFLAIGLSSALLNSAGFINVVLSFLLWTEPFLILLALVSIPLSHKSFGQFRAWMVGFNIFHLLLALFQRFVLNYQLLGGEEDNIQGVFYRSGSGHVVGSSVSMSFCFYYFVSATHRPLWLRLLLVFASFLQMIVSDTKQVIFTFVLAFAILILVKVTDVSKTILYIISFVLFIMAFDWAINNLEAFEAYKTWMRPDIYGSDGEATKLKFLGFRLITSHFHSSLNWWLGLGPGHTIDRLGGWMLRDYSSLLTPLGATRTRIGDETWLYTSQSWLGDKSSFFSTFWGWQGMWGDLGFLGLGAYIYICSIVWRHLCVTDFSKMLLITTWIHGFIFTQMQEPAYMLLVYSLIGMQWHEKNSKSAHNH